MNSICMIVQSYYDGDARVRRKAEALVAAGYEVDVIALMRSDTSEPVYQLAGVNIYTIPLKKKRGSLARYIFEYAFFLIMAAIKVSLLMVKKKYKVIEVNNMPDFLVFSALFCKLLGAKIILDMHDIMPEIFMFRYGLKNNHFVIRFLKFQEFMSMKFADHVLMVNDPICEVLKARGAEENKITIVMNSADDAVFRETSFDASKKINKKYVMLFHGTMGSHYGLDLAIKAFGMIHNQMENAEFLIIGRGPERPALEEMVRDLNLAEKVRFIGVIPYTEMPTWIAKSDVGIFPARQNDFMDLTFSNKICECIMMAKPQIISRIKTVCYYLSENAIAYFEPHNVADLADKMLDLYQNPERGRLMTENAKNEYKKINWDEMKKRYLSVMHDLIKT